MPADLGPKLQSRTATGDQLEIARLITDNASDAIFLLDGEGRTTFVNPAGEAMFGWDADDLLGRKLHDLIHHHRADGRVFPKSECPLGDVFVTGENVQQHEDVFFHRDGRKVQVACSNAAIMRGDSIVGSVLIVRDNTARHEVEQHRQLLVDELHHRVKNMLAVVQAIVDRSLRGPELETVRKTLAGRITSLANAQNLLNDGDGLAASLRDLVQRALAPFPFDGRINLSGPDVVLPPRSVTMLSMAIHELATNAVKYGALSNDDGRVLISWEKRENDGRAELRFVWCERGGPAVQAPRRKGFGSRMIERGFSAELGGSVRVDFDPAGIVCTVDAPFPSNN